jgi:Tol biopolymer transport system component
MNFESGLIRLPSWSPDRNTIAFLLKAFPGPTPSLLDPTDIWTVSRSGAATANLTTFPSGIGTQNAPSAHRPVWSPMANELAYILLDAPGASTQPELTLLTLPSAVSTPLTAFPFALFADAGLDFIGLPPFDNSFSWSPDGSQLAFPGQTQVG